MELKTGMMEECEIQWKVGRFGNSPSFHYSIISTFPFLHSIIPFGIHLKIFRTKATVKYDIITTPIQPSMGASQ